jgi:hypothetical protein
VTPEDTPVGEWRRCPRHRIAWLYIAEGSGARPQLVCPMCAPPTLQVVYVKGPVGGKGAT